LFSLGLGVYNTGKHITGSLQVQAFGLELSGADLTFLHAPNKKI
jgi:hypothetical protein